MVITPVVSVLMTAYNREKYIAEAIESVLASTFTDFELIIVDDCSKDNTVEIARKYEALDSRVKVYINKVNLGDYPNRNMAASHARGGYIMYVDSDDSIKSDHLSKTIDLIRHSPNVKLILPSRMHDKFEGVMAYSPFDAYYQHFYVDGFLETGPLGALIDKSVFIELDGFSGRRMIGDVEFFLNVSKQYDIIRIESNTISTRIDNEKESNQGEYFYLVEIVSLYKKFLFDRDCPLYRNRKSIIISIFLERELVILKKLVKSRNSKYFYYLLKNAQNLFRFE